MPLGFEKKEDKATASPKKKQQKQLMMLGGVVLITVIVLLWGFGGKPSGTVETTDEEGVITVQTGLEDMRIELNKKFVADDYSLNEEFFDSQVFKDAKSFGEHPVVAGQLGASNPFMNK